MGTYSDLVKPSEPVKKELPAKKKRLPSKKEQEKANVSKHTRKHASKQVSKFTSKHVYLHKYLNEKAYVTGSFRLPPTILEKFDEIFYLTKTKYKAEAKRYAFVVVALAMLFWDFEKRGEESDLYKLLIEKPSSGK